MIGLGPTRDSSLVWGEPETSPKTEGVQSDVPAAENAKADKLIIVTPDGALAEGWTGSAPRVESGTAQMALRGQTLAADSNAPVNPNTDSPEQRGTRSGQKGDDPEPDAKAPKRYPAEKAAANQNEIRSQDAPLLVGILPERSITLSRTSSRAEPAPLNPPPSARVSPDTEFGQSIRPQPLREISLQLADEASNQVDIRVLERAGKVEVAVRTGDQVLTTSLQTNLGELVGRMEEKGYKTETWIPTAPLHVSAALPQLANNPGNSQDRPGRSGSWAGHEQQRREQQQSGERQQPRWMTEFQETLDGDESSTDAMRMEPR